MVILTKKTNVKIKDLPKDDVRVKRLMVVINRNGRRPDTLIEVLHAVQELFGYVSIEAMNLVAKELKVSPSKVFGVVTFYHFFMLKPKGEHNCLVCTGTACHVKGAQKIITRIQEEFSIKAGETTPDGKFGLQTARCLGCCGLAPAVVLDGRIIGKADPEALVHEIKQQIGVS